MVVINKLALWLGRIGIGVLFVGLILVWLDWQTDKRVAAARLEGKAQCEAEYAKDETKKMEKEKEVQNEKNIKKAVIWASPNLNRSELLKLMHNNQL